MPAMPRTPPARIGRPSSVGAPRDIELRVRVTEGERSRIAEAARAEGVSLSDYVRDAVEARLGQGKRQA
jgi:hypothetical protein